MCLFLLWFLFNSIQFICLSGSPRILLQHSRHPPDGSLPGGTHRTKYLRAVRALEMLAPPWPPEHDSYTCACITIPGSWQNLYLCSLLLILILIQNLISRLQDLWDYSNGSNHRKNTYSLGRNAWFARRTCICTDKVWHVYPWHFDNFW